MTTTKKFYLREVNQQLKEENAKLHVLRVTRRVNTNPYTRHTHTIIHTYTHTLAHIHTCTLQVLSTLSGSLSISISNRVRHGYLSPKGLGSLCRSVLIEAFY